VLGDSHVLQLKALLVCPQPACWHQKERFQKAWSSNSLLKNQASRPLFNAQGDELQKAHAVAVICSVLETLRIVAVALKPVVPKLSERMYEQLGFTPQQFQVGVFKIIQE
jgi:methionyl-tRNA synthetase